MKGSTLVATAATAITLVVGTIAGATALHKDVTLTVDGASVRAGAFGTTVADLLSAEGVVLGERDLVFPSVDTALADGDTVTVQYSKPITVEIDGSPVSFYTTATTVAEALAEVSAHDTSTSKVSVDRSMTLPRNGIDVEVTTPKALVLTVGGKKQKVTSYATTVPELLGELSVELGADDRVSPSRDSSLRDGDTVVVDRVKVSTKTQIEAIEHEVTTTKDASLWKGESSIATVGKDGKAKRTYLVTTVNGKQESKKLTAESVLADPVTEVRKEGTKVSANGVGINLARSAMWDRIARCESGGNWKINTGNGYYGGLQFSASSWRAMGGRDFAALPHQASRAQQITVANRYYARAGLQPWGCRHAA